MRKTNDKIEFKTPLMRKLYKRDVIQAQKKNSMLKEIRSYLKDGTEINKSNFKSNEGKSYQTYLDQYDMSKEGILVRYWVTTNGRNVLIVLTKELIKKVLWIIHNEYIGHLSLKATMRVFLSKFHGFGARKNGERNLEKIPCMFCN